MNMREDSLSNELLELLGKDTFVAFVEAFGGRRLLIPLNCDEDHLIARAIGGLAAKRLSRRFSPDVIRVPLAREIRARHYRYVLGLSHGQIATKLCMTENGVGRILKRLSDAPPR